MLGRAADRASSLLLCTDICFPVLCELPLSCEWERKAVSHRIIEYPKNIIESNPWLNKGLPKIQTLYLKTLPKGFLKAGSLEGPNPSLTPSCLSSDTAPCHSFGPCCRREQRELQPHALPLSLPCSGLKTPRNLSCFLICLSPPQWP